MTARREVSDQVVDFLLSTTDRWVWPREVAKVTGLQECQVRRCATFLLHEYDAVDILPSTGCLRLVEAGFVKYVEVNRNYHPKHLWPEER
jgi:hypothetical protein